MRSNDDRQSEPRTAVFQAMDEWSQSEDSVLWEATVADGLDNADEEQAWIHALSLGWDSV